MAYWPPPPYAAQPPYVAQPSYVAQPCKDPSCRPPPQSAYQSVMIKIRVGTPAREFSIHRDLLCHHSSYFRQALNGGFKEAQAKRVAFVHDCPKVFEIFASWVYSGQLYDPKDPSTINLNSVTSAEKTSVGLAQVDLVKLWIFGDKLGIPSLQNQAINDLRQHLLETWSMQSSAARVAFEETPDGSKLRAYFIEAYARTYGPKMTRDARVYPGRLLSELCDRLIELRDEWPIVNKKDFIASLDMCQYHIHDEVD